MSNYREKFLDDLDIDELMAEYHRACFWEKQLKDPENEERFIWTGIDIEMCLGIVTIDKAHIWKAMETKIPQSHIETIKQMSNATRIKVAIGQRWEHKNTKRLVLEIFGTEANNPDWQGGLFLENRFIMNCKITLITLLTHYKLLNP